MPEIVMTEIEEEAPAEKLEFATFDMLAKKKPTTETFTAAVGPGGRPVAFTYVAISSKAYDALLTECPPSNEQRANGASFDGDSFGPAIMAVVCRKPRATREQWASLPDSENWSRGEISSLFYRAMELCNHQVDTAPISAG